VRTLLEGPQKAGEQAVLWDRRNDAGDLASSGVYCRVGGGAFGCPHAGLRPPLKPDVRFSRIRLSRRRSPERFEGWNQTDKVDQPTLAIQLRAWKRFPSGTAPPLVSVRPESPHDPSVKLVEEPSDVGALVVLAPTSNDGVDLLDQLLGRDRSLPARFAPDLLAEVPDRLLSRIGIQTARADVARDLARWEPKPLPELDLISKELEAVPHMDDPLFCGLIRTPSFSNTRIAASRAASASLRDLQVTAQSSAYLVSW
jgi:hypothetical protein